MSVAVAAKIHRGNMPMVVWSKLSPKELERRRIASVQAVKARRQKEFDRHYQEHCDRLYWAHGPCCAGCDHWRSEAGETGECTAAGIASGADVLRSMGITFSSYLPAPGFPSSCATDHCGLFRDDFDWASLGDLYLRRIGAYVKSSKGTSDA